MKLTTRGFTLVELMIVIAIIGILAAALFPSMTGYLKRSRDTARQASLKDITTAVSTYNVDNDKYPDADAGGCVNNATLSGTYMPKGVPFDPQNTSRANSNGCTSTKGEFAYGSGTLGTSPSYAVGAYLENLAGGNTGSLTGLAGGFVTYTFTVMPTFSKAAGSGYVLMN